MYAQAIKNTLAQVTVDNFPSVGDFPTPEVAMHTADLMITKFGFGSELGDLAVDLWDDAYEHRSDRYDDNWTAAEMRAMDGTF